MRAEELVLVEHPGKHPPQLSLVNDRREPEAVLTRQERVMDELAELGSIEQEVAHQLAVLRVLPDHLTIEGGDREQRQQTHERPNLEALAGSIG